MITPEEVIQIGTLRKTHGTRGELVCALTNALFEAVDPEFVILECNNILVPFYIEEYRYKNDETLLLQFEHINTETQAARLLLCRVFLLRSLLPPHLPLTATLNEFCGYEVIDSRSGSLGTVESVDDSTANILFQLTGGLLIPAHDDLIDEIDDTQRIIRVSLPDGIV